MLVPGLFSLKLSFLIHKMGVGRCPFCLLLGFLRRQMTKWFVPLPVLFTAECPEPRTDSAALSGSSICPSMRGLTYSPAAGGPPSPCTCLQSTRPHLAKPLTIARGRAHGPGMHREQPRGGAEVGQDQSGWPWGLKRLLPLRNSGL